MPTAKLVQLGCTSGCCDCDCDRIVGPIPPYIICGCKYRATFSGSFSYNYNNPGWAEEGCGLKYRYANGSISKGADLIFYGGSNGMEGETGVQQECTASYGFWTELCDADGDEKCCNEPEDSPNVCTVRVVTTGGCNSTPTCSFSDEVQTTTVPKYGSVAGIKMKINSNGQMEVINLGIIGFNGPSGSGGTTFPVTVSFPGGSQQVTVASPFPPNGNGSTTTFSGSVSIS